MHRHARTHARVRRCILREPSLERQCEKPVFFVFLICLSLNFADYLIETPIHSKCTLYIQCGTRVDTGKKTVGNVHSIPKWRR